VRSSFLLLVAPAFALAACGPDRKPSDAVKPTPPKAPTVAPAPAPGGPVPGAPVPGAEGPQGDPRFAMLKPYFHQYLKRPLDAKTNVFKSNLAQFAPRVEIEVDEQKAEEEPKTPLEYHDVDSYRLVLIMSGTAISKALLVDPKGKSFIVTVGTKVGNRGGKVAAISATEVRIEEPARPPVVKALELPSTEMERELQSVQEF
jgi:type IV pilus assembly protein PilP